MKNIGFKIPAGISFKHDAASRLQDILVIADQPASDEARRGGMMGLQLVPPKPVMRNDMPVGI